MAHIVAACIFWSLLIFGRASSLSVKPPYLDPKTTKATLGGLVYVSGNQNVSGRFQFSSPEESDWVNIVISMRGLLQFNQTEGFAYHVHEHAVVDGNCSSALGHFKVLTPKPSCKSEVPDYCQPAELAIRHGNLPGLVDVFTLRYNDNAIELTGPNSIIGKSVVIHGANKTRLACGNIDTWTPGAKA
ncbi:copper/zinc superoxide dismutase [Puccinia triticina 1-1 BBBD Race 1]|uniref:Copper/zinc superoxide dismutase n=1 Tax=Puccinia triticina (isolate 1-1 / race 1 (BBBD)) TaxID=630390 RepID=A0A0C4EJ23_PUCT1|nr:copper/zinc superoxide dismutase [Puccinia triticina 1-1 BBBD Race 1]WAR62472.1 hypothetical protein PtB15_15B57 [Puccinia triticina]